MKKVSVELKADATVRTFYLFPSPETIYEWSTTPVDEPPNPVEGLDTVELEPGHFFEAEWLGCEFIYDGPVPKKFVYVRLAMSHESKNSSGTLVTMHYGWIEDSWIPFYDIEAGELTVKRVSLSESRLNMPELFPDEQDVDVDGYSGKK